MKNGRLLALCTVLAGIALLRVFDPPAAGASRNEVVAPRVPESTATERSTSLVSAASTSAPLVQNTADAWPVRHPIAEDVSDIFSDAEAAKALAAATQMPAPPSPKPARPFVGPPYEPPPQAPALPFVFIGEWTEDGKTKVFLGHGQGVVVAEVGAQVHPQYRVESVEPGLITMQYLPLQQMQELRWSTSR